MERRYAPLGIKKEYDDRLTALEGSSGVAWGAITGTLSDQTDLQTELDAKASLTGATFTGAVTINAAASVSGELTLTDASYALKLQSTAPKIWFYESDASANNGKWDIVAAGEQLRFRAGTDAESFTDWMTVDRTGSTVDAVALKGRFYVDGSTAGHLRDVTGTYGSVEAAGEATWNGFNCSGDAVLMWHSSAERGGIYDDNNNCWTLQWNAENASSSEKLSLYTRDNTTSQVAARTQDYTLTGNTSSFEIRDSEGTYYDAGYNVLPVERSNASFTLDRTHCGQVVYYNNTTAYTITTPSSGSVDFPVGGMVTIVTRKSSGNLSINAGSGCTIYWHDGTTTSTSGNRTMVGYAVANLWRYSTSAWFIWGNGIS